MIENASLREVEEHIRSGKAVVLDFYADWCIPCRAIEEMLEQVAKHFKDREKVVFLRINVDLEKEAAERFDVYGLPTVIVIHRGEEVKRFSGVPRNFSVELAKTLKSLH
ncbi:MAG: thioredoxin family protein [Infirmifilum sp.]|jgi:thioredoxin 1|uniref:thioredoxin family protein n=1 Tax=Infirmifilum TaxID=2856573 RepID=UPI00069929A1|nr:thioredoxin family protein [Infirmifilum uzonense]